uniref:Glycosyl transferase n=1 Tax=Meloidogyne hapla TaxID=6305 RepID=A0A1I8AZD3_MELHA
SDPDILNRPFMKFLEKPWQGLCEFKDTVLNLDGYTDISNHKSFAKKYLLYRAGCSIFMLSGKLHSYMDYPAINIIASQELVFSMIMEFNLNDNVDVFNENEKRKMKDIIGNTTGIDNFYQNVFYIIFKIGELYKSIN